MTDIISTRPPRLLFLAYFFPPANAIASVRGWNIAKYLARMGWDVTVVTPHHALWRHRENPEQVKANIQREGFRCLLTSHQWRCLMPNHLQCWNSGLGWCVGGVLRRVARRFDIDSAFGWMNAAQRACARISAADIDVILASGPPFTPFMVAQRLSKRLGRPYVLDYRDPWTGNPHAARPPTPASIAREAALLNDCAAITIVSNSWGSAMIQRFSVGSKLHVITNGYDPEELDAIAPHVFDHFAIVYTGNFYPPKRTISPILAALCQLKKMTHASNREWRFHYYGDQGKHVQEEAMRFGLLDQVMLHGRVSRLEALSAVRGAGVNVVITSVTNDVTREEKGIIPGKVFESLGLNVPTLVIAPPESDIEKLVGASGLVHVFSGNDITGIASFLSQQMSGQRPHMRSTGALSWPNIAQQFAAVLDLAIKASAPKAVSPEKY